MMTPEQIAAMQLNNAGAPFDGPLSSAKAMHDAKATIIAQAAEIARLTEMLTVQWEGIPWRDGPPPAEWRDGRQVLVWTKGLRHVFWEGAWFIAHENGYSVDQSMITHHAAVNGPHEKSQPG